MNKFKEAELLELARNGDGDARHLLITNLMHQVKYIAKDYANKGLDWDDIVQEGKIGLIKSVDYILKLEVFDVRVWTYAKRKVRDAIRGCFYAYANTIRQPKSFIKKQRALAMANSLESNIIQETNYDNDSDFKYGRLDGLLIEQDNWNRLTLNTKLLEILDSYLSFDESEIIKLKFGFGHEYFDTPDWQKPNKALTVKQIASVTKIAPKKIKAIYDSALAKLQTEEVKYQLLEWKR